MERFISKGCILVLLLLACASFLGCKSITVYTTGAIENKLPSMIPVINTYSLENAFGVLHSNYSGSSYGRYYGSSYGLYYSGISSGTSSTYRDVSIRDVVTYCEREINDNICESLGKSRGKIVIKTIGGYKKSNDGFHFPSILFGLCTLNLFGFPWASTKGGLQLQMEIYNNKDERIAVYRSNYHSNKRFVAMYWGYNSRDGQRQCIYDSVEECMDDLKKEISRDFVTISSALLED